jgi:hypothetical protein
MIHMPSLKVVIALSILVLIGTGVFVIRWRFDDSVQPASKGSGTTTYKNMRYGFAVEVPAGWSAKEIDSESEIVGFAPVTKEGTHPSNLGNYPLVIDVYGSRGARTAEEYYAHICDGEVVCPADASPVSSARSVKAVEIAGEKGIEALNVPGPAPVSILSFIHGQYLFEILEHNDFGAPLLVNGAFNRIVESFSFR